MVWGPRLFWMPRSALAQSLLRVCTYHPLTVRWRQPFKLEDVLTELGDVHVAAEGKLE